MDNEGKSIKKIFRSDVLKWIIVGLFGVMVLGGVFGAGVKVGEWKARHSYRFAENYHKNFGGPRGGFFGDWRRFPHGEFMESHGTFGEIIQLDESGFVVQGRDDMEVVVATSTATIIKNGRETVSDGLKVGDRVVIIGAPDEQGKIEAKLIRIF